jgi:hypothetical protein
VRQPELPDGIDQVGDRRRLTKRVDGSPRCGFRPVRMRSVPLVPPMSMLESRPSGKIEMRIRPAASAALGISPTASVSPTNAIARFMFPLVCVVGSSLPRQGLRGKQSVLPRGGRGRRNKSGRKTAEVARDAESFAPPHQKGGQAVAQPPWVLSPCSPERIVGA